MTAPVISATEPGGLEEYKRREIAEGQYTGAIIEFEQAPVGYLTKKGEPRKTPWRAYFWTPSDHDKRKREPSVTTVLTPIMAKPGIPPWSEARGIVGTVEAFRQGIVTADTPDPVRVVRDARLGADAAKDEAASRGVNVHALLEDYMVSGKLPSLSEHPFEYRGYIRALAAWLLHAKPKPVLVEALVCDPVAGYAGRMDLLANIGGDLTAVDLKTNAKASIWESAHVQLQMYVRGHVACGGKKPTAGRIVVLAEDGGFAEMECEAGPSAVHKALAYSDELRPIRAACARHNAAEKKARVAA